MNKRHFQVIVFFEAPGTLPGLLDGGSTHVSRRGLGVLRVGEIDEGVLAAFADAAIHDVPDTPEDLGGNFRNST